MSNCVACGCPEIECLDLPEGIDCCEECGHEAPVTWTAGTLHCSHGGAEVSFHPPHVWTYTRGDGSKAQFNCPGQGEPAYASPEDRIRRAACFADRHRDKVPWEYTACLLALLGVEVTS